MKIKEEVLRHLKNTVYAHSARNKILGWLIGKGVVSTYDEVAFKQGYWQDGVSIIPGHSFEDFIEWYELFDVMQKKVAVNLCDFIERINEDINKLANPSGIYVGDFVKVHDLDNPRSEYVEFVVNNPGGTNVYGLSDGSWVPETCISKYAAQGDRRKELIDALDEVL